jgi:hypothetical protein
LALSNFIDLAGTKATPLPRKKIYKDEIDKKKNFLNQLLV